VSGAAGRLVRLGTRASALARHQADLAATALRRAEPGVRVEIVPFTTRGDRDVERPLPEIGGKGVFTEELERALLLGEITVAVHSLKDLPTAQPPSLRIAAVLERGDPGDVLVSRSGATLASLPPHPGIGSSSTRRAAQIAALRPDARLLELRGNVETRVRKALDPSSPYDAIVLAAAGVARLGLDHAVTERLAPEQVLPAPGQGAIALQCRSGDGVAALLARVNHPLTWAAVSAERAFLAALEGGCAAPIAAFARAAGASLTLEGLVASTDGRMVLRRQATGPIAAAEALGRSLAEEARRAGADRLL
jgi:hydroxymethylbilane synthase